MKIVNEQNKHEIISKIKKSEIGSINKIHNWGTVSSNAIQLGIHPNWQ